MPLPANERTKRTIRRQMRRNFNSSCQPEVRLSLTNWHALFVFCNWCCSCSHASSGHRRVEAVYTRSRPRNAARAMIARLLKQMLLDPAVGAGVVFPVSGDVVDGIEVVLPFNNVVDVPLSVSFCAIVWMAASTRMSEIRRNERILSSSFVLLLLFGLFFSFFTLLYALTKF